MTEQRPLRVLHALGSMHCGGIETWLMHILRQVDRERLRIDFLVQTDTPGAYDEEIRALGSAVIPCVDPRKPWRYARNFNRIMREHGPYDIIHSHEHHYSGYILRLAARAGIPVRIAHSHLDTSLLDASAGYARRCYLAVMRHWLARYATVGLAASREAAIALFGPEWETGSRNRLLYCGIDLTPFCGTVSPSGARAAVHLPQDAFVLGHVGRFEAEQKNHRFLIQIAAAVVHREPRARLLLIGDGPLRPAIEEEVARAGLAAHVIFAGARADVPDLLRGAIDVFVLPSLYEGLPVVGMEAQAAGLPCILSDTITPEVIVIPELVRRLSLAEPSSAWADAILATRSDPPPVTQQEAVTTMQCSPFNIQESMKALERIYVGETTKR